MRDRGLTRHLRRGVVTAGVLASVLGPSIVGPGRDGALALALLHAGAMALVLWGAVPPRWREAAMAGPALVLLSYAIGARQGPAQGMMAVAGMSHALLYAGLLFVFARTLRPGVTPLVTGIAQRINRHFTVEMATYTRSVTLAWCLFFAAQIIVSAVLLSVWPRLWLGFVTAVHGPLALVMAAGEYAVRAWRFRGQPHSTVADMVRAVRSGALTWPPQGASERSTKA